jgi:eukaryotic translation initiation factor 2C
MVLTKELPQLQNACKDIYGIGNKLNFIVIVVGKRHHTRFYPTVDNDQQADRKGNCKSGTVVDRGITDFRIWDFYAQSHAAIQGTARPAHYVVIHDEIFKSYYKTAQLPPNCKTAHDALEVLTHAPCFTYGRATKSVGNFPAAKYADMACDRARFYLKSLYEDAQGAEDGLTKGDDEKSVAKRIAELQKRITITVGLEDTMFYI